MGVLQDSFPNAGKDALQDGEKGDEVIERKKQSHTVQLLSSKERVEIRVGDKVWVGKGEGEGVGGGGRVGEGDRVEYL